MNEHPTEHPTEYPEAEKWAKVANNAWMIVDFVEWNENRYGDLHIVKLPPLIERVYEYYGINSAKLETERRAMIDEIRNEQ